MAESKDRKTTFSINDDMIKEVIKSGLSNIKASDDLINITLEKCKAEIENKQEKKSRKFITMAYKVGAPLAVGALVLVLIINSRGLFSKKMYTGMAAAPQAPVPSAAAPACETGNNDVTDGKQLESNASALNDAAPEGQKQRQNAEGRFEEQSIGLAMMHPGKSIAVLNSSANRSVNNAELDMEESVNYFTSITDQYNLKNGTKLSLAEEGITRIYTLPETGVNAETLNNAEDYQEILSGEGYWALPLKNQDGVIDVVLTVAEAGNNAAETFVSDSDTVYSAEERNFIVSSLENSSFIGSELYELFDKSAISGLISKAGYEYDNKAEMIIADINYGTDFIVLTQAKNEKLVVPLLTNENLFGVVNRRVYTWPEFVNIISSSLGQ